MSKWTFIGFGSALLLSLTAATSVAINVTIDYTYDTNGFFPPDSQARSTLEAAASFYSLILEDTFSSVTIPPPLESQVFTGVVTWKLNFRNPTTDEQDSIFSATIAADEYRIYAGARSIPGSVAGEGSKGSAGATSNGGGFSQEEVDQYQQINDAFLSAANTRGEPDGFATWGGAISIDTDAENNWHFDYLTPPAVGEVDLFSVVLHELGHALGLGNSSQWSALVTGSGSSATFNGAAATAEHGSNVPMAFNTVDGVDVADNGHWRKGTMSTVFGTTAAQEALMAPSISKGTRRLLTSLDAAGLTDIGWSVIEPGEPGDYNGNGIVDSADYTVWRDTLGQSGAGLAADGTGPGGVPDGVVDQLDYDFWKANFGNTLGGSGSGAASAAASPFQELVPEPASLLLLAAAALAFAPRRRRG
jgi:Matrixin